MFDSRCIDGVQKLHAPNINPSPQAEKMETIQIPRSGKRASNEIDTPKISTPNTNPKNAVNTPFTICGMERAKNKTPLFTGDAMTIGNVPIPRSDITTVIMPNTELMTQSKSALDATYPSNPFPPYTKFTNIAKKIICVNGFKSITKIYDFGSNHPNRAL